MAENYFGITDTGKQRSNNEDAFIAQFTGDKKYIIACVIDGVGGYSGGEVAAAIARETIIDEINKSAGDINNTLVAAFHEANSKIFHERTVDKKHDSMACVCTLVAADLKQNQFHYAHVGDTRLYLLRDDSLIKISSDHSFVGFLEDSGRLTEEAAMNHPKRNEINKALGFEPNILNQQNYIETGSSPFLPGDTLLLCSDGLTDMVNKQDITDILTGQNSLKEKGKRLIDLANHNGGHDNVTAVLVANDRQSVSQEAVMPAPGQKKKPEPEVRTEDLKEQQKEHLKPVQSVKPSGNRWTIVVLGIMIIAFIGSTLFMFLRKKPEAQTVSPVPQKDTIAAQKPQADPQEQKLVQAFSNIKGDTLTLSDSVFKNPVTLSNTIAISKDTLFVNAKGNITLKAAAGFNGPALALPKSCKVVMLHSLVFDGFKIAVTAYNNALVLKNVRFVNCAAPVQVSFTIQDTARVTGWLPANVFKPDTTAKKPMKK